MLLNKRETVPLSLLLLVGSALSIVVGALALEAPFLLIVSAMLGIAGLMSLSYPNLATQVFVLLLYTNTPVIASKFHGLPFIVAAIFPLILLVPLTYALILRREQIIITREIVLLFVLLLVQLVGSWLSIDVGLATETLMTFVIEGVLMYALVVNVIRTRASLRATMLAVFVATIVLGVFPLFQYITNTTDHNYGGYAQISGGAGFTTSKTLTTVTRQLRYSGAIGEQNRFAQTMFMLVMLALPHVLNHDSRNWRLLAAVTVGVGSFAGILAFSRGAAVGMGVMFLIALVLRLFSWRHVLITVLAVTIITMTIPQYVARLLSLQSLPVALGLQTENIDFVEPDGAVKGRLTEMMAAGIVFAENPIVGVGPGMFKYYAQDIGNELGIRRLDQTRRSHSLYLDILSNTGILGLLSFTAIVYLTIRNLLKTRAQWRNRDAFLAATAEGFILAIITYLSIGIFLHFAYVRYFWVTMAIAGATVLVARQYPIEAE